MTGNHFLTTGILQLYNGPFSYKKKKLKSDGSRKWAHQAIVDCCCSSLLSLHCWKPEVFAALLNQPHAVPSSLGATKLGPSLKTRGSTPNLERAGPQIAATVQPSKPESCSITLKPPLGSQAGVTQLGKQKYFPQGL